MSAPSGGLPDLNGDDQRLRVWLVDKFFGTDLTMHDRPKMEEGLKRLENYVMRGSFGAAAPKQSED